MSAKDDWAAARLGDCASIKARIGWKGLQASEYREEGYIFLATPNIKGPRIDFRNVNFISERRYIESPELMLEVGDVLLVKDGSTLGISNLVRTLPGPATVNGSIAVLRCSDKLQPVFLHQLTKAHAFQKLISDKKSGLGVPHLFQADLREFEISLPPVCQQHSIAKVLDYLDTAIHETEAIIAKLKAVKQGLLHDLLTRGIDANGELRPPQAEAPHLYRPSLLGWIPKEWDIATLEAVSSTVTSGSRDWARFYADSGALFVRIGNLTREHINLRYDSTIYVRPPRNADGQRTRLESGDILISITADLGIVGVVPEEMGEAYINQHIALVRPNFGAVNPRFVGHYLASPVAQTYINQLNDAGAKAGLNLPTVRGLMTAKPQRVEQDLVAAQLDEIDNRIQNATIESAKLRELKAGLMDDLLTGRVRVTSLLAAGEHQEGSG